MSFKKRARRERGGPFLQHRHLGLGGRGGDGELGEDVEDGVSLAEEVSRPQRTRAQPHPGRRRARGAPVRREHGLRRRLADMRRRLAAMRRRLGGSRGKTRVR